MKIFLPILLILLQFSPINCKSTCIQRLYECLADSDSITEQEVQQLQQNKCLIQVTPRYRWGQSMTHIFVKIQYITSTSTTPCENALYEEKKIDYEGFSVRKICFHRKQFLIDYQLKVKTFKSLNYHLAVWKEGGQNSLTLECLKSPYPYFWGILHSRTSRPKRKPKVWWQIYQRFEEEVRDMIDYLELETEQKDISGLKKRKKKGKEECDIQFYCQQGSPLYLGSWL